MTTYNDNDNDNDKTTTTTTTKQRPTHIGTRFQCFGSVKNDDDDDDDDDRVTVSFFQTHSLGASFTVY